MNVILLLLGALVTSTAPLMMIPLAGEMSPAGIAGWRMVFALPLFLAFLKLDAWRSGKPLLPFPICLNTWQIVGAVCFAANGVVFAASLIFAPTAIAYVVAASTPAYMLAFQLLFGKTKPMRAEYLIAAIIVSGLLLFFIRGWNNGAGFGVICAVAAGILFAGYIFAQGRLANVVSKEGRPLSQGTPILTLLIGPPMYVIFVLGCSQSQILPQLWTPNTMPATPKQFGLLVLLAVQIALPAWLWAKAIPKVPAFVAGAMPTLAAIWGPIWTALAFGEELGSFNEVLGLIIVHGGVLVGLYLQNRRKLRPEKTG